MGLLGNSFTSNFGAGTALCTVRAFMPGNREKRTLFIQSLYNDGSSTILSRMANPIGSNGVSSWQQPRVGGGAAMRATGIGDLSANAVLEKTMSVDFSGDGDLTASGSLVISALCAMTGTGNLSADIAGIFNASVDFTGDGDLSADIVGIANAIIDMIGSGDLSADIVGIASPTIDIVVTGTGLTVESIAAGVWDELIANHLNAGSTGAALNAARSAGDPWITTLPGAYAPGSAGSIIGNLLANIPSSVWDELLSGHVVPGSSADQLKKTLTTIKFLGLKD